MPVPLAGHHVGFVPCADARLLCCSGLASCGRRTLHVLHLLFGVNEVDCQPTHGVLCVFVFVFLREENNSSSRGSSKKQKHDVASGICTECGQLLCCVHADPLVLVLSSERGRVSWGAGQSW